MARFVSARLSDRCRLLFVGVDWTRKGGIVRSKWHGRLTSRDFPPSTLLVHLRQEATLSPGCIATGFIDKSTEEGWKLVRGLYSSAHFLIHPASAECFGVVFSEAAAYGVVSLGTRVGGIPTTVRHSETGALFDVSASADDYAECIRRLLGDGAGYQRAALAAFDDYQQRLSREAAAEDIREHLGQIA